MKDIIGYEGLYAVTSCGKVWSYKSNKFLAPNRNNNGYCQVSLMKNGKRKVCYIHRLVAQAFLPNPNNLPEVNHKDECKENNCLANLEWCDRAYNLAYGTRTKRTRKPIYCVELDRTFEGVNAAAKELNLSQGNISNVCHGKLNTTGGYHFKFV